MAVEEKGKAVGPHNPCIPNSRSKGLGLMKEKETQQLSQKVERAFVGGKGLQYVDYM